MTLWTAPVDGRPRAGRGSGLLAASVIILISMIHMGLSVSVASKTAYPEGKAERWHLLNTMMIEDALSRAHQLGQIPQILINSQVKFPPLLYVAALISRAVSPAEDDRMASLSIMIAFILALNAGFYLLLRQKMSVRWALLGTALLNGNATLLFASRIYSTTFPCVAMTVLTLGLLVRLRVFVSPGHTMIFGLICGLDALLYYAMPLYIAPAVIYMMILRMRGSSMRGRAILMIAAFLAVAALVASPYYLSGSFLQWAKGRAGRLEAYEGPAGGQGGTFISEACSWLLHNVEWLVRALWAWPVSIAILALGWKGLRPTSQGGLLWASGLFTVLVFSLFGAKYEEYLLPLVPLAAYPVCLALNAPAFRRHWWAAVLIVALLMRSGWHAATVNVPRLDQAEVGRIFDTIAAECEGRGLECIVLMTDCEGPGNNYFLQANRARDPGRMWIRDPINRDGNEILVEDVEFIVAPIQWYGRPNAEPIRSWPDCGIKAEVTPGSTDVRLTLWGEDITDRFDLIDRASGDQVSLLLYRKRPGG